MSELPEDSQDIGTIFRQYSEAFSKLNSLIESGHGDGEKADALRDYMDDLWKQMNLNSLERSWDIISKRAAAHDPYGVCSFDELKMRMDRILDSVHKIQNSEQSGPPPSKNLKGFSATEEEAAEILLELMQFEHLRNMDIVGALKEIINIKDKHKRKNDHGEASDSI